MEKEFVTYEQALALKELGFDEKCLTTYTDEGRPNSIWNVNYSQIENEHFSENTFGELWNTNSSILGDFVCAPLKQQVFRWFMEKHECYANLSSWIHEEELGIYHVFEIYKVKQYSHGSIRFKTYEEAENACIDKLIEVTKESKK